MLVHTHPLHDVEVVFLRVRGPIHRCASCGHTAQLILLSDVFWATMSSYDMSSFLFILKTIAGLFHSGPCLTVDSDGVKLSLVKSGRDSELRTHLFVCIFWVQPP